MIVRLAGAAGTVVTVLAILVAGPASAAVCRPGVAPNPAVAAAAERRFGAMLDGLASPTGTGLYAAQTEGMVLLDAIFELGDRGTQADALARMAGLVAGFPRIGDIAPDGLIARLTTNSVEIDGLTPPAEARNRRVPPIRGGDGVSFSSGVAQQFGYLVSGLLRRAAEAGQGAPWPEATAGNIGTLFRFAVDDTLRFYWEEMPAWHWAGAFDDGIRARSRARLAGEGALPGPAFFRAFLDYDLHVFAIAADLAVVARHRPDLLRPGDGALIEDVLDVAFAALRARLDGGTGGNGFGFDRGMWRKSIGFEYTACETPEPPDAPCGPPAADHPDVSHAQRWPHWLESFILAAEATGRPALAALLEVRRAGLAQQIAARALYRVGDRPVLRNFIDRRDGWYRYREGGRAWGHPPSSMTGWAFGNGNYARLAPLDARLAEAQADFCAVVESRDPADMAFRTNHYSLNPIAPRPADQPATDPYAVEGAAHLACRINRALGCFGPAASGHE